MHFKKMYSYQFNSNSSSNSLGLLFRTILLYWDYFLSSVAEDGKDENGLKLEKIGP